MADTPNEVDVNETGCSCAGYCRACHRFDADPACPRHGTMLGPDDGDVTVIYPDGREVVLHPPGVFPDASPRTADEAAVFARTVGGGEVRDVPDLLAALQRSVDQARAARQQGGE